MISTRWTFGLVALVLLGFAAEVLDAQRGRGRGGGRGRAPAVQVMALSTTAWADGGRIPARHTQAGGELSPAFSWSRVPDGTTSFVLIVRDLDAPSRDGSDDRLHWMLWNIPGTARGLPAGVEHGPELPDGTRQISASGPYYRGPAAAPSADPPHHYLFELYALDAMIDVPAVGASPTETRAAVEAATAGHIRAKAHYVGLFK